LDQVGFLIYVLTIPHLLSQPYLKKAENDKKRYQEEMQNYEPDAEADE
jgi:hypothetical protein